MKYSNKRTALKTLALMASALVLGNGAALAEAAYPQRSIVVIVPQSPGSVADIMARAVSASLSTTLGQTVVVDNRAGASGIIGAQSAARAAPDGYTLFIGSVSTHGLLSGTEKKLPYDPVKDFRGVSQINDSPLALVVHPDSGLKTLKQVVERARQQPGVLSYASAGNGSGSRFTVELLRVQEGLDMLHVPYRSPMEAVNAVVAGQATLASPSLPSVPELIKANRLTALAVTGKTRSPLLPDVPTTTEAGYPGVQFTSWTGLFAPAGTPDAVIQKLNKAVEIALKDPAVIDYIEKSGATPVRQSPAAFDKFVKSEVDKWVKAARDAGVSAQ